MECFQTNERKANWIFRNKVNLSTIIIARRTMTRIVKKRGQKDSIEKPSKLIRNPTKSGFFSGTQKDVNLFLLGILPI
jgi:hypothetical protein